MSVVVRQSGASLVEVLVVLAIVGLALSATAMNLEPMESPLQSGCSTVQAFLREARVKAIASTSAYRVSPQGSRTLTAEYAPACSETSWTPDASMALELPDGVSMTPTTWAVCFGARGLSTDNVVITLSHAAHGTERVEILVGGMTRVLE